MTELFESSSHWIPALGKALIHSLWIGVVFLSIMKILFLIISQEFSRNRYRMATLLLFTFTGTMVMLFTWLYSPLQEEVVRISAGIDSPFPLVAGHETGRNWMHFLCQYSSYAYFSGIMVIMFRTALAIRSIQIIRKNGVPVTGTWLVQFNSMKPS